MQKRGQITTFIIIGIIILAIVSVVLYFRGEEIDQLPREAVSPDVKPVQLFVEECIQKTAVPGIYQLGMQGGYIIPPEDSFSTELYTISYGLKDGKDTFPTIDEMQQQVSDYLKLSLPLCINGFEEFEQQGITIEEGELNVETRIFKEEVMLIIDYPLNIIQGESKNKMSNFMAKIPVSVGENYNLAKRIAEESQENIILNDLLIPNKKVNLLPSSRDTMIVSILDEEIFLNNRTFLFMFAYELDKNRKPSFDLIYNQVFESGEDMNFEIIATDPEGDALTYSSDSTYFNPNPSTGEINTKAPSPGIYRVKFFVEDGKGGLAEKKVIFNIIGKEKNSCISEQGVICEI